MSCQFIGWDCLKQAGDESYRLLLKTLKFLCFLLTALLMLNTKSCLLTHSLTLNAAASLSLLIRLFLKSSTYWATQIILIKVTVYYRSWYWCLVCGSTSCREKWLFPVFFWEIETAWRNQRLEGKSGPFLNNCHYSTRQQTNVSAGFNGPLICLESNCNVWTLTQ